MYVKNKRPYRWGRNSNDSGMTLRAYRRLAQSKRLAALYSKAS